VGGVPLLLLFYPLHILLCIGLSLNVLRRPGPSLRVMGDLARRRARPWLAGASVALLAVSLLVTVTILVAASNARLGLSGLSYAGVAYGVARIDLLISSFIAAAVLFLGQAVVSYEVFTGKTLPRRGFAHHWRRAVILAAGYAAITSGLLILRASPIYALLSTAVLMVVFFAMLSWRSFVDRERTMEQLRPFVSSQRLYETLLTPSTPPEVDVAAPFRALCEGLLDARVAYLVALGPLASLVGPPLVYPAGTRRDAPIQWSDVVARFDSPKTMCAPLDPARHGGAAWAVPLWSERGLIGVLLLGEKRDGGLYTQEEIEIARASGERLIDTQASVEMARRLMALQRQRLTESQVLDRQARRVLHDDVLPRLHAAMLTLNSGQPPADAVALLADAHRRVSDLLHEMPPTAALQVRQLGLVGALRQVVDTEMGGRFDSVTWQVSAEAERKLEATPPLIAEVLFYAAREAVRNAARHGGADGRPLHLRVAADGSGRGGLELVVEDDGVGLDPMGRSAEGGGLALHSTMMAVVGGTLAVESALGTYTRVVLTLPQ
jgi:signal transduction histidine kinase